MLEPVNLFSVEQMRCFFRVVRGSRVMTLFQTGNRQVKNDVTVVCGIDLPGGLQYYKVQHHSGTKTLNTSHTYNRNMVMS